MPDVLGKTVPNVEAELYLKKCERHGFCGCIEALEFERHACVWRRAERAGRTVKNGRSVKSRIV